MNDQEVSLLIVEDEPVIRTLLLTVLGDRFNCEAVESADEAIRLLGLRFFHVVLADVGLPGASGLDLCRTIRRTVPRTLVVLVSGKNDPESAAEAKHAGAFDFLSKPFDLSGVIATVERAIDHHTARLKSNSASPDCP